MMLFPKPAKPERGTAAAKRHMAQVAQQPCIICSSWPVVLHHVCMGRYSQTKASDFDVLPLCPAHHDELHAGPRSWRERYGRADYEYLPLVRETLRIAAERTI